MWAAVIVGVLTLAAMVALMSARYERNYFAEAWTKMIGTDAGRSLQKTQQSVGKTIKADSTEIRKCMVNGKPVYSNVECDAHNPTSQKLDLQDSKGIDAPKVPVAPMREDAASAIKDKMIEQAVGR